MTVTATPPSSIPGYVDLAALQNTSMKMCYPGLKYYMRILFFCLLHVNKCFFFQFKTRYENGKKLNLLLSLSDLRK